MTWEKFVTQLNEICTELLLMSGILFSGTLQHKKQHSENVIENISITKSLS